MVRCRSVFVLTTRQLGSALPGRSNGRLLDGGRACSSFAMAASKKPATTNTLSPKASAEQTTAKKAATAKAPLAVRQNAAGKAAGGDVYVALMRGINVGGNNMIAMKDLTALFEEVGCSDVRSYIQSGNVVFRATAAVVKGLHAAVERALVKRFGTAVPLVLRSQAELAACDNSPFLTKDADRAARRHVSRSAAVGDGSGDTRSGALAARRIERARARDLHSLPEWDRPLKLTNQWFDSKLKAVSTGRNWNTVLKLLAMCAE